MWKRNPENANGVMERLYLACLGDVEEDGLLIMWDDEGSVWHEWVEML